MSGTDGLVLLLAIGRDEGEIPCLLTHIHLFLLAYMICVTSFILDCESGVILVEGH